MTGFKQICRRVGQARGRLCLGGSMAVALSLSPILATAAAANTALGIRYDTSSFDNLELSAGDISIVIDYATPESVNYSGENLHYELLYQDQSIQQIDAYTATFAQFQVEDLDSDGMAEVVVQLYSGGAHCCTNTVIYTWDTATDTFTSLETGYLDGTGIAFEDLDGDGYTELIGYDNAFLYRFDAYAFSYAPHVIHTYRAGEVATTTRNFPALLQARISDMEVAFERHQAESFSSNGLLAGYVAENILVGNYEMAWQFMLDNYDPESVWGLDILDNQGEIAGRHTDFPKALRSFLMNTGYLDDAGNPIEN